MLNLKTILTGLAVVICGVFSEFTPARGASLLTNSENDFVLEQGVNGWYYGYDNGNGFQEDLDPHWGSFDASNTYLNGQNTPKWIVRQWRSNFNGTVSLSALMPKTNHTDSSVDFKKRIRLNGKNQISQDSDLHNGNSEYKLDRIDVKVGSTIEFAFAPTVDYWSGQFDIVANITAPSGLIFMNEYPGSPVGHLGLLANGKVYEANPNSGVQAKSFNEFIESSNGSSFNHEFIELPELLAQAMGNHIETKIGSGYLPWQALSTPLEQKGKNGLFTNAGLIEWAAEQAKVNFGQGFIWNHLEFIYGNGLNCIGGSCSTLLPPNLWDQIIPLADANHQLGKIIDDDSDFLDVGEFSAINTKLNLLDIEIANVFKIENNTEPSILRTDDWIFRQDIAHIKSLSPEDIKYAMNSFDIGRWLQGSLDSVDFLLTDPFGRKMGYTQELGFFNEIPDLFYSSQNMLGLEDSEAQIASLIQTDWAAVQNTFNNNICSSTQAHSNDSPSDGKTSHPVSRIFNFSILNRLPGEYKIQQIGRDGSGHSSIDDGNKKIVTKSDRCPPVTVVISHTDVPEPSGILGLIVLGLLGMRIKKRY